MKAYIPSKELLEDMYSKQRLSVKKMSQLLNVSYPTMCTWLGNYGLGNYKVKESKTKSGTREDIGIYVRSSWEANYVRILNLWVEEGKILDWEYEPQTFIFEDIRRGTRSYTPDFRIYLPDGSTVFHEVKGRMDKVSATKLKRMAKYYPEYTVVLIDYKEYKKLEKEYKSKIENWE